MVLDVLEDDPRAVGALVDGAAPALAALCVRGRVSAALADAYPDAPGGDAEGHLDGHRGAYPRLSTPLPAQQGVRPGGSDLRVEATGS